MRASTYVDRLIANPVTALLSLGFFLWSIYAWAVEEGPWVLPVMGALTLMRIHASDRRIQSDRAWDDSRKRGKLIGTTEGPPKGNGAVRVIGHPLIVTVVATLALSMIGGYAAMPPADRPEAIWALVAAITILAIVVTAATLRWRSRRAARTGRGPSPDRFLQETIVVSAVPPLAPVPALADAFARLPPALRLLTQRAETAPAEDAQP